LAPRPDGRTSEIVVRRAGLGDLSRPLDRAGFRPQRISDLAPSIALVSAALLLMLLLLGRGARAWALFEARLAERFERAQKLAGRRGLLSFAALPGRAVDADRTPLSLRIVPYVGFFAVSVALSALALGHPLPSGETDLPIWVSSAGAASAIAAFIRGGRKASSRSRRTFQLGQGLTAAAQALLLFLPVVIAAALAVYGDGSLRLSDIVAAQGPWPNAWRALESPWSLLAFVLLVFSSLPDAGARPVPADEALAARTSGDAAGQVGRGVAWHMAELLEWLGLVVTCALGATVFLGGWCTPGGVPLLGAALLLAKTWALVCAVSFARQVLAIRRSEIWSVWARFCLPLSFGSFALHVIATSTGFSRAEGPALELSASALLVCVVAYCVARSLRAARRKLPNLAINPWL
jgi:NADH-quinone oxidoreductase subunit H